MALTNEDLQVIKELLLPIQNDMQEIKNRISSIESTLENGTNKNIQLIAENHVELANKLNDAIPAVNNNLIYEVKVNFLVEDVEKLKKEILELKSKIV